MVQTVLTPVILTKFSACSNRSIDQLVIFKTGLQITYMTANNRLEIIKPVCIDRKRYQDQADKQ